MVRVGIEFFISETSKFGGTGALPILLNLFTERNDSDNIYFFTSRLGSEYLKFRNNTRIIVCPFSDRDLGRVIYCAFILPIFVCLFKLDRLVTFNYFGAPFCLGKLVMFVAGIQRVVLPRKENILIHKFMSIMQSLSLRYSTRIIVPSHSALVDVRSRFMINLEKIHVIYFAPRLQRLPEEGKQSNGIPSFCKQVILSIGTAPQKNIKRLVSAYLLLENHIKNNTCLVIVGPISKEASSIMSELKTRNVQNVFFLGPVPDWKLRSLYSSASVVAMVSVYETFGYPVLEAFQYGVPVLCSNQTSLSEIGFDAVFPVDPHDVTSISSGLHILLTNRLVSSALICRGYKRVKLFSWEKAVTEFSKVVK